MARDKLITVRIEEEKREAFKQWADSRNQDASSLLYDFIDACLDERIDESILSRSSNPTQQLDNRIANLEENLKELDKQLDEKSLSQDSNETQQLDNRIANLEEKLKDLDKRIDDAIDDSLSERGGVGK